MADTLINGAVEDARGRMLSSISGSARTERAPLNEAHGRILASDIIASRDQPPFAASAMDGYALASADTPGRLVVIGEASAGSALPRALITGEAARIFTGAPVPDGADSVAIQEDVTREGDSAAIPETPYGQNIRPRGLDFRAGDLLLRAGTRLDGIALSLAAAAGGGDVAVRARPRIALMSTGDEIVQPGVQPGPYQIFDSVSFGLAALVEAWGGIATRLEARDDKVEEITRASRDALETHDLIVTIGGASVGDYDLVKPALKAIGLQMSVEKVNMRPGKPVWFGKTDFGFVLGLPGNPASALVCAHLFLKPIIAGMMGVDAGVAFEKARLAIDLPANGPREHFLRSHLSTDDEGRRLVTPFEQQDSSLLSIFRDANALVRMRAKAGAMRAGDLADVLLLAR
ncbi:MAG: gephyrin-like molybdotransferase Glp [Caulobacterales bacterium]